MQAQARIQARIERLAMRNAGDVRSVGEAVSETRIAYGPGYLVDYTKRGRDLVLFLAGGDKRTQTGDIKTAVQLHKKTVGAHDG